MVPVCFPMFSLHRLSVLGLEPGWNKLDAAPPGGIYTHPPKDGHLCMGYAVYCRLRDDGIFAAIKVKIRTSEKKSYRRNAGVHLSLIHI